MEEGCHQGSFRDLLSGFVFRKDGRIYRQVNPGAAEDYDRLMTGGLYQALVRDGLLVAHEEVALEAPAASGRAYKVLAPAEAPFVSYPYEWCFSQLKDAALATLEIQRRALEFGMTLKDASAYNIQFFDARPVLIDTLSFETYRQGQTWPAYRQFCQHFLAPLALMARRDVRLGQSLRAHLDGLPLDLASRLLPLRTHLSLGLKLHLHLHARSQARYADRPEKARGATMSGLAFRGLIDSLVSAVAAQRFRLGRSLWSHYYDQTNYSPEALEDKAKLVRRFLQDLRPRTAWDLGANTGRFSRIAAELGAHTVAFEYDPVAVEMNYLECRRQGTRNLLPLVLDLTNPSPSLGWAHRERDCLEARGPADVVLMLALIHHLAIGNNLPLERVARYAARIGRWLVVEFVPKSDSQVGRLLAGRQDVFPRYAQQDFEADFLKHFEIRSVAPIAGTQRRLYLMQARLPVGA